MDDKKLLDLAKTHKAAVADTITACSMHGDIDYACTQTGVEKSIMRGIFEYSGKLIGIRKAKLRLIQALRQGRDRRATYAKQLFLKGIGIRGIAIEGVAAQPWFTYRWFQHMRDQDQEFRERWEEALESAKGKLIAEAWRRGYEGVDEPVVFHGHIAEDENGNPVTVKKYSDQVFLKLWGKYDRELDSKVKIDLDGKVDSSIDLKSVLSKLTPEELESLENIMKKCST